MDSYKTSASSSSSSSSRHRADLDNCSADEAVQELAARTWEVMDGYLVKRHLMEFWLTVRKFVPVPLHAGMSPGQHLVAQLGNIIEQLENYLRAIDLHLESEEQWRCASVVCISGHMIQCRCMDATWEPHPLLMHWLHQEPQDDKATLQALMDIVQARKMLPSAALPLKGIVKVV